MSKTIPDRIDRNHIIAAIQDLQQGARHSFGESTGYDVLFQDRRYPPKAVIGLAAGKILGTPLGPSDFKGGVKSKCFRILESNGFVIVRKNETNLFPMEIGETEQHIEGAVLRVLVNKYERDLKARTKAIKHYGMHCRVCDFNFKATYGALGEGFIHVHHTVPLSSIGGSYVIDPINDLRPVCPNCHAMLHKRIPPYTLDELKDILAAVTHCEQGNET